jgi:hypothetical protein
MLYIDISSSLFQHQAVAYENILSLHLYTFFSLMLLFRVLWDVVQIFTLDSIGVLDYGVVESEIYVL